MSNTTDPRTIQAQTHCPGCGLHKDAVSVIEHDSDGGWKCAKCIRRAALIAVPPPPPAGTPQKLVAVACPSHNGQTCRTCGGFNMVRVPEHSLKVYDPNTRRLLTEG